MTTQEAYETIRAYFSRPDAVLARGTKGECQYRTPDGNACAVGCLIPDELYYMEVEMSEDDGYSTVEYSTVGGAIEGNLVNDIYEVDLPGDILDTLKEIVNGDDEEGQRKLRFLNEAQQKHDHAASNAPGLVELLDVLASEFNLDLVVVSGA